MDTRLLAFKEEVFTYTNNLPEQDWNSFQLNLTPVSYKKGMDVFPVSQVCKKVLFITEGLLASEFHTKEERIITRFFKPKDLCSNIVSLFNQQLANDRLFALTHVEGILIPYELLMENYLYSSTLGLYFRRRVLETLLIDKYFMSTKSVSGVKPKLTFLQENYPEVILHTPWKYIANFMGVTPAWLSRVLKKRENTKQ
ncbi:MAG: hypothetical protein AAGC45_13065 [Bacteroidota bacterium]